MVERYPVIITGLRGQKSVEIDADVSGVPWSIGFEGDVSDGEAFEEVLTDLTARVAEEVGRDLDDIPSSTQVGALEVNNVGAWSFIPGADADDDTENAGRGDTFGDLSPQTGEQATLGDAGGGGASRTGAGGGGRGSTDREQMDLTTAGQQDPGGGQTRVGGFDDGDGGGGGDTPTGPRSSGPSTDRGQSGLDRFAADRQESTEAVREKGLDGENFGDEDVREARVETPGEGVNGPERDPIERVVRAAGDRGGQAVEMRRIGLDDSVIAAMVSELERELRAPISSFDEGEPLATATFAGDGDRFIEIELEVDPTEDDARAREAAATGAGVPDPEDPPSGWNYAPASRGDETVERWRSDLGFDGTPLAQVTIDTVTDGGFSIQVSGLSPDALRQGRTVYRSEPQRLPDDVMRSMNLPVESREQALLRAFDAMENFDVAKYNRDRFGQEIDARQLPDGTTLEEGDVISIAYESNRGGGEDSIDGRIVSLSIPGGRGIKLTRNREWDSTRNEVRIDGTKVGDTPDGDEAITLIDAAEDPSDETPTDERLDQLIDEVSEMTDGFGDRVSADADVRETLTDFDLDPGMWGERQSQDVFRHGIGAGDMIERWRGDFNADRDHDPDEIGEYVRALISALEDMVAAGGDGGDGGDTGDLRADTADRDPFEGASKPTDVAPRDYPEPGTFSLRSVEGDRVEWVRTTDTMRQRQGISEGGGTKEVPVEGRQRVAVRKLMDTGWQVRRATEYFRDGGFTRLGRESTIAEVGGGEFPAAIDMAVDEMAAQSGSDFGLIPIGVDVEPDSSTLDSFGGGE